MGQAERVSPRRESKASEDCKGAEEDQLSTDEGTEASDGVRGQTWSWMSLSMMPMVSVERREDEMRWMSGAHRRPGCDGLHNFIRHLFGT